MDADAVKGREEKSPQEKIQMKTITLNIAGEQVPCLFDGKRVTSPDFPSVEMEYLAPCGTRITQEMLVTICKNKTQTP